MKVITLCGSTKFKEQFEQANRYLTLQGKMKLSMQLKMGKRLDTFLKAN
ncbi:hypothetical protein [Paenibacillus sp. E194]|nr:hypothetical protein [Paenibacillus sp. E194]